MHVWSVILYTKFDYICDIDAALTIFLIGLICAEQYFLQIVDRVKLELIWCDYNFQLQHWFKKYKKT